MLKKSLPQFNDNPTNVKRSALQEHDVNFTALRPVLLRLIDAAAARLGKDKAHMRVLDFGCGRGELVAALRQLGYDCYGVEVEPAYVDAAAPFFQKKYNRADIISLLDRAGRSVFPDGFFDLVVTDQVIEHVENMDVALSELARVLSPAGVALHMFPSDWSLVEAHLRLPIVHWIPKGPARRRAIHALLGLGLGARLFTEYPTTDRAKIFSDYCENLTFYRSIGDLSRLAAAHGLAMRSIAQEKIVCRGGPAAALASLPVVGKLLAEIWATAQERCLLTAKDQAALRFCP